MSGAEFGRHYRHLADRVARELLGKENKIELALTCILADGHLLLEDLPGLGKTKLANALAHAFGGEYRRVQGTPDLLPSDITGSIIFGRDVDPVKILDGTEEPPLRKGPVFANVLLCDEINRTPPRTQSALLEAMEERQTTIFARTYPLPDPFFVIATQNPVDLDGTYPLPEAQLDRFLMRFDLGYPSSEVMLRILAEIGDRRRIDESAATHARPVVTCAELVEMIRYVHRIPAAPIVRGYVIDLVDATRVADEVLLGASPRAALALLAAARAFAAGRGSDHVEIDHVHAVAAPVLAHRIVLRSPPATGLSGAQAEFVTKLVGNLPTPKTVR